MSNRLIHSTSPYLLQHAHNPVDWFEWGKEALEKAHKEDKPILVSIGYSSCHWCHVMERESFENQDIASVMNEHFVCIKVDREERPDIDQIYMDAVQAMGVNGGWPLNVFLTPGQKPFFGGTYFSPAAWVQILTNINRAFIGNRKEIESTAEELRVHLLRSDVERFRQNYTDTNLLQDIEGIYQKLAARFDTHWGGMDRAPKFIMPSVWQWLLRYYYISHDEKALEQVLLTLRKVGMGGIYDQIGGGFARYSVDGEWFAPHFEKMLYDNAQLLSLYSEAYSITGDEEFKTIVYETFTWLQREMTSAAGGFYSALDADSEGVEGKYYCWTSDELKTLLKENATLIASYYSVAPHGNWEHGNNILTRLKTDDEFFAKEKVDAAQWKNILQQSKDILLREREKRIKPGLDDKIITAWNAMMIVGLTDAYRAFADKQFLNAAVKNMQFLENELMEGTKLYRSFKGHRSTVEGFLDDYAYVIQAYSRLYEVTFNEYWINRAAMLLEFTLEKFFDPAEGYFFYTGHDAEGLIARKKEIFDNVIPSSNAIMAHNLLQLGITLDRDDWKERANAMTTSFSHLVKGEPNYMSYWAIVYTAIKKGMAEVAIVGNEHQALRKDIQQHFYPFALYFGTKESSTLPLLADKTANGKSTVYVCRNKTCQLPVHTAEEAGEQIEKLKA
ncbi:MAG TPA: thioredoxin domain-containing protein [Ohtaekwangia sp.]|uniref:thioredoxin domain-containing protein n=1 Tax=Ohtaekwangia sp. TaxID=2066019 RepID=UPI002F94F497